MSWHVVMSSNHFAGVCVLTVHSITDFNCEADDFYPDDEDCTIFYECHRGKATQLHCASGLGYRSDIRTCDLIQYVKECRKSAITEKEMANEVYRISEDGSVHNFIPLSILDQMQNDDKDMETDYGENQIRNIRTSPRKNKKKIHCPCGQDEPIKIKYFFLN